MRSRLLLVTMVAAFASGPSSAQALGVMTHGSAHRVREGNHYNIVGWVDGYHSTVPNVFIFSPPPNSTMLGSDKECYARASGGRVAFVMHGHGSLYKQGGRYHVELMFHHKGGLHYAHFGFKLPAA